MIITIDGKREIDTDRDLSPEERHVIQKLFGWKDMAQSVGEFRLKKKAALREGWNNSGPVRESKNLKLIAKKLEEDMVRRLKG